MLMHNSQIFNFITESFGDVPIAHTRYFEIRCLIKIFLVRMLYWIIYPIGSMPRCISFSQLMPWLFLPLCNPNMNPMICTLGRSSRLVKMIASVLYNAHSSFPLLMALAEKIRIHIKTESTILVNRDSTQKDHVLIAK